MYNSAEADGNICWPEQHVIITIIIIQLIAETSN